jgi:membrane-bound lytic murein transglycosylase B
MARHRLRAHAEEPAVVCGSVKALAVWRFGQRHRARSRQSAVRLMRHSALSIATIAPLVLACAAGGGARRIPLPAPALPPIANTSVAVVAASVSKSPGRAVVVVARPPTSVHIAAATKSAPAPPMTVVNSSSALGIPSMALAAYRNAEQKMATSDPGCGISWNLLAGIGRIESGHANGGATDARGTAVHPIYGPALDGTLPGNEVIVQSGAGGQVRYARAMGPMQFLPGTWARYASDGDGDGIADPQNLYDSTLAAARYLCSGGLNLRDQSQVMTAILRYNNSIPYARNVLGWAAAYASGVVPVDLPPVTGPAPPLADLHLENPEGLGPGLPLNVHGLPSTDPLVQMPLIDFGPPAMPVPQPVWPPQPVVPDTPGCTVICIESQTATNQHAP